METRFINFVCVANKNDCNTHASNFELFKAFVSVADASSLKRDSSTRNRLFYNNKSNLSRV